MLFSGIWDDFTMISTVQWVDRDTSTHTHVPIVQYHLVLLPFHPRVCENNYTNSSNHVTIKY